MDKFAAHVMMCDIDRIRWNRNKSSSSDDDDDCCTENNYHSTQANSNKTAYLIQLQSAGNIVKAITIAEIDYYSYHRNII